MVLFPYTINPFVTGHLAELSCGKGRFKGNKEFNFIQSHPQKKLGTHVLSSHTFQEFSAALYAYKESNITPHPPMFTE